MQACMIVHAHRLVRLIATALGVEVVNVSCLDLLLFFYINMN